MESKLPCKTLSNDPCGCVSYIDIVGHDLLWWRLVINDVGGDRSQNIYAARTSEESVWPSCTYILLRKTILRKT